MIDILIQFKYGYTENENMTITANPATGAREPPNSTGNISNITVIPSWARTQPKRKPQYTIHDYFQKYEPTTVLEKLRHEEMDDMTKLARLVEAMDPIEDLLKLKIQPVHPDPFNFTRRIKNTQAWHAPPNVSKPEYADGYDRYYLRPRIFFLIQQAMYQARDSLIEMQMIREQYRSDDLYRMGVLMATIDWTTKLFAGTAYKAQSTCMKSYRGVMARIPLYEMYEIEERLLNYWHEVTQLSDLAEKNVNMCTIMLNEHQTQRRKHKWFIP